jgi:hypothetical protein
MSNLDDEPHFLPELIIALAVNAVVAVIAYYAVTAYGLFSH